MLEANGNVCANLELTGKILIYLYFNSLIKCTFFFLNQNFILQGLEVNPNDAWSTHSLNHVLEYGGRHKEGIQFLNSTLGTWDVSMPCVFKELI